MTSPGHVPARPATPPAPPDVATARRAPCRPPPRRAESRTACRQPLRVPPPAPACGVPDRPAPGRAAAVLGIHFGGMLGVPAVSDGYVAYDMLPVRQGCWVHLLREAEERAVRNGGPGTSRHRRPLSICRAIKGRESADSSECPSPGRAVPGMASSYPGGRRFRAKLGGPPRARSPSSGTRACRPATTAPSRRCAAPPSFTGTCAAGRPRRREGGAFPVPVSTARTCREPGVFPRTAAERLAGDPDWRLFKPPPGQERQEMAAPVAAAC